jgi:hypothetical protein
MTEQASSHQQRTSPLCRIGACLLLLVLFIAALPGCGSDKPSFPSARLEGSVTLDGQPIGEGNLQFVPQDVGKAPVTAAPIVDGRYVAEAVPHGKLRVLLTATKKTGKMIMEYSTPRPEIVNVIPSKYRSGIPIDVSQDNPNMNFALQSR